MFPANPSPQRLQYAYSFSQITTSEIRSLSKEANTLAATFSDRTSTTVADDQELSVNSKNETTQTSDEIGYPQECIESSLSDEDPDIVQVETFQITYHIIESSSARGKPKLFDSSGFQYTLHRTTQLGKRGDVQLGTRRSNVAS